ncbi:MAG: IscS subfamily cysteine desulfurase [Candidatus Marinimicrobia bacterium]|nr:IscS subfamily cysteine desulfurase [Candidatus Neomarinimicrobiota bacterium]
MMNKIYLDNNSTTQIDPKVLKEMIPYFSEKYGNPSSQSHAFGWEANAAIDIAREKISKLINSKPNEIIFTSGATESNNLAINGLLKNQKYKNSNIITSTIEHKAVLDVLQPIKNQVTFIAPNKDGIINIKDIEQSINEQTILISIMHANNEIGTIQPIKQIGNLCKKHNIIFHVDAAQSLGKSDIDVIDMNIDLLSISAHKIYGPKGIGALYINDKKEKFNIHPLIVGGGQENNYRSGTLATPLIVGFGKACDILLNQMNSDNKRILKLTSKLKSEIISKYPSTVINGSMEDRIPGNINLSFPFLNGLSILRSMPRIAISSGSACSSSSPKPSHVLTQIGRSKLEANTSIRIGIGRFNKEEDIDIAIRTILNAIEKKI